MLFFFSRKFIQFGEEKNKGLVKFSNAVNEAVYGIKEIKILGLAHFFESKVIDGASRAAAAEKRLYLFFNCTKVPCRNYAGCCDLHDSGDRKL